MVKHLYKILLIILLLDLAYSFYQHYHMPLYGDMPGIIIPTPTKEDYQKLQDPFGLKVLLEDKIYANPNRFFAYWSVSTYFKYVPIALQRFVKPIDSIYLSCAIVKIIIQILIIYLLAVFISNTGNLLKLDFIIAAILITPLFQTSGFSRYIGIIDQSVIYTFFYALPLGLTLLFFLPFFKIVYRNNKLKLNFINQIALALLIIFISFSGPLVPGVILIVCPMVILLIWVNNYNKAETSQTYKKVFLSWQEIPNFILFYFIAACILSLYSLYIGKNNALNFSDSIPIIERYSSLPTGLYNLITKHLGFPILLIMIIINIIVVNKSKSEEGIKILKLTKWIGVFAILYILLLPLGGYRIYRPNIIRYDTIMPLTLAFIFVFGISAFYLIKNINRKYKKVYISGLVLFSLLFTNADRLETENYECERQAIETIATSPEKIVPLDCDCPVMDWQKMHDYNLSELNAELFNYWNITNEKKLYYHTDVKKK